MEIDKRNFYIFGEPVKTEFGMVRFLTYKEYWMNISEVNLISQNVLHLYYLYKRALEKEGKSKEELKEFEKFKELDLYDVVISINYILESYIKIFKLVLDINNYNEEELNLIIKDIFSDKDSFHYFRKLIMDMNVLIEEDVSHNEEIQRAIERSRRVKQRDAEKITFVDIVTSIVATTNNSYKDVCNMTVFQVHATYARIGAIYNYNTSTLFATVAEKVQIESWNKHIDLFEKQRDVLTKEQFKSQFGGIFNFDFNF